MHPMDAHDSEVRARNGRRILFPLRQANLVRRESGALWDVS